jgi:hypothetical protein
VNPSRLIFALTSGFILLFALSCSPVKTVLPGEARQVPNWKSLYVFHAGDSTWIVKPTPARGNQFSGQIFRPETIRKHRKVNIYAEPPSSVTVKDGKISVPMENIVKVENFRITAGMVILSAGVLALLFLVPVYL